MASSLRARGAFHNSAALLAIAAFVIGLLLARLPLPLSLAVTGGGALLLFALVEPLAGLAFMLLLGPAEPLLYAAYPSIPIPWGQIGVAIFVGGWTLRCLARRELRWPHLPITLPFVLYLFAITLSFTVQQVRSPFAAMQELVKWLEMYLVAGIVAGVAGRKRLGWVLAIVFLVGVVQAGIGFWQFQFRGHGPEGFRILGTHFRAYGTFEQPNPFGGFMGLVWPVAASLAMAMALEFVRNFRVSRLERAIVLLRKNCADREDVDPRSHTKEHQEFFVKLRGLRGLFLVAAGSRAIVLFGSALVAIATLAALFLSFSRGAWLGAVAAAGVMLIFWPRRRWFGIGLAAGGLAAFLLLYNLGLLPSAIATRFADVGDFVQVYDVRGVHINDSNFSIVERLAHWQAALNMAEANPIVGVGLNNYDQAYDDYRLINWRYSLGHAHMIYLNVLAETGIVGLAAYLFLWGGVLFITVRAINRNGGLERALAVGLLGAWVHLATHQILDNLYVGNIALYLGALLGVLCILGEAPGAGRNDEDHDLPSTPHIATS
ncbi:MAG: O-antigen ligase family protein [Chloroflexi bacterium]|nr:O-antigen ligase family protein [Chloroflexota bacterium]